MNEVVVITGGSAGVGRATARAFAERGFAVALLARGSEGLRAAAKEVDARGSRALPVAVDVSDGDAVDEAASRVEEELGPIDIWVNDAMSTVFAPLTSITPAEFKRVTEVTYLGFVNGTMAALKRMMPRDQGTIVQVGSALAFQGIPLQSAYCGAKHAIHGFTESVRAELFHERKKIHITEVHLPAVNTPQFDWCRTHLRRHPQPVPPIYQPEVPAQAIVEAAFDKRQQFLLGASTVKAVLGNRLAPWLMTKITAERAWEQQMTEQSIPPDRPDNLFHAVAADAGAHGDFDDRARGGRVRSWTSLRAGVRARDVALAAAAAMFGFGVKLVHDA
jgi:NAD(P)-dependent dehydrogenase (short-subunit alcohol dehydrogenase family)